MEISVTLAITVALRLLVPILIFKWRIVGVLLAALADALDVLVFDALGALLKEAPYKDLNYQFFDKWLDMYYLTFAFIVSFSWKSMLARNASIFLYFYRLLGLILFEISGIRKLFFFFPNLFENFYLYYEIAQRFFPKLLPKTLFHLFLALLLLAIPKLAQEWILHYEKIHTWQIIKNFLGLPF